jgi:predicted glycosyltransferase
MSAQRVFCRSGYSTLCDLASLGRRAVLVPTPRQPEQEYLAEYFRNMFNFLVYRQEELANVNFPGISYDINWNYNNTCKLSEFMKIM